MTGIFDNDGAIDWLTDFTEHPDIVKIKSAFRLTGDQADYPDALDCEEALAAAAIVASLLAKEPVGGIPHAQYESLLLSEFHLKEDLKEEALRSCKHILSNSELRDLWEEDEQFAEWELSIREVMDKLSNI